MHEITELSLLSRITMELPVNLRIATEDFEEGWNIVRSGNVYWMDRQIRQCGWHLMWIAEPSRRSGVGQTEQAAIAAALKLALRLVDPGYSAASVDEIEVIKYPWFFIAKVRVSPYRIQQSAELQKSDGGVALPAKVPAESVAVRETLVATAV